MTPQLEGKIKAFIEQVPPPEGWASTEKALAMADLILRVKPDTVVEIGVFGGRSLVPQAMACQANGKGAVVGIDAWRVDVATEGDNDKSNDEWWRKIDMEAIYQHCLKNVRESGAGDHCIVARLPSQNCFHLFTEIDILHIDGAHSEVASVRDVVNYMPKVRPGGFIWFDDTDWETTKKAVSMVEQFCDKVSMVGSCALYQKKI